jgi:hypothetical protein
VQSAGKCTLEGRLGDLFDRERLHVISIPQVNLVKASTWNQLSTL